MKIDDLMAPGYPIKFSGGEIQIRLKSDLVPGPILIEAQIKTSDDVMTILLTKNALDEAGFSEVSLHIPYVPYGRQDRVCFPGEAFSLKVFAGLINSCNFKAVTVVDPHSLMTTYLIERCEVISQSVASLVTLPPDLVSKAIFMAPDLGAVEKTKKKALQANRPYITADKVRSPDTGSIMGIELDFRDIDLSQKNPIIVMDDICDGGRTFIELAKEYRRYGYYQELYLYITHGIFSQGISQLLWYYQKIFCYNYIGSNPLPSDPNFKVYK